MPDLAEDLENHVYIFNSDVKEKEGLEHFLQEATTEDNNRARLVVNSERWFKKRFGIRPQIVTWPWRNASNLHMPFTDKYVRRNKPTFINLSQTYPTVALESNVLGDDQELIRGMERWFHGMLHDEDKMATDLSIAWGVDIMLGHHGRFITKVVQEFTPITKTEEVIIKKLSSEMQSFLTNPETTDDQLALEMSLQYNMDLSNREDIAQIRLAIRQLRNGNEVIIFEREVNLTPFPSLFVRDPLSILFPSDTTFIISQGRWIRDRVALSIEDIDNRVQSNNWDKANGNILLDRLRDKFRGRTVQNPISTIAKGPAQLEEQREGVSPSAFTGPLVDEYYFWRKMPGKRMVERMVLTISPIAPDLPLRLIRYPYLQPNGRPEDWPFDQVQYEIVGDRAYAPRGYPQLLDSLQTAVTNNHNAKQNWMTIANSLNLKVKRNSGVTTQWIPGQPLWVNRQDDVMELNIAPRDLSFDNEERILKQWGDEYIGIMDSTITNQTGTPERRTKAEVDKFSEIQAQVSGLDAFIYQKCMQRVYKRIWNRAMQFGPDEITFLNSLGQVIRIPKTEVQDRFGIVPTGNILNSNRIFMASQAKEIVAATQGSPFVDGFQALSNWLYRVDERLARSILRRPEQVKQQQIERFIDDIMRINAGYTVVPRADDDNQIALAVIEDFLKDPVKRRTFQVDRLETLKNFKEAHELALQKKKQATTRGGRAEQEVAKVAMGARGREAKE